MNNRTILIGDVIEKIQQIPNEIIDCVVTSPPYWGLRDYGVPGQWGLEKDFHHYLFKMKFFMEQVKRVLKPSGTVWINLGDTYSGGVAHSDWSNVDEDFDSQQMKNGKFLGPTKNQIQSKSLMCIPDEFKINCRDDGWHIRNHIPWIKDNAMPSSVKDRLSNKWESLFFMTKSPQYYFNLAAIRVKAKAPTIPFNVRVRDSDTERFLQKALDGEKDAHNEKGERKMIDVPGQTDQGIHRNRVEGKEDWYELDFTNKQDSTLGADGKPKANYVGFNERWKKDRKHKTGQGASISDRMKEGRLEGQDHEVGLPTDPKGKNPGDVLYINARPFPKAHFATFPPELPEFCLRCGCPPGGTVLDPFFGSGTVGVVAEQMGLNWIGIELKEEYITEISAKRLDKYKNHKMSDWF